ncbi:MAG TPA: hypothetical protein VFP89_12960 [Propionibacteriaceae bacterium]|nr:hypothetical protein [Propionibacteriaceae bacterium]
MFYEDKARLAQDAVDDVAAAAERTSHGFDPDAAAELKAYLERLFAERQARDDEPKAS